MIQVPFFLPPGAENAQAVWSRDLNSSGAAATSVSTFLTNSQQRPMLLTNVALRCTPGAAQSTQGCRINVQDPDGTVLFDVMGILQPTALAGITFVVGGMVNIILPPRYRLGATATFSAGGVTNSITLSYNGWLVARGSLSIAG